MTLAAIRPGLRLHGIVSGEAVEIVAKALAFRASDKLGLTEEAQNYNQLVGVWGDILTQAEDYKKKNKPIEQGLLDF
jgi:hypothetical protein